MSVARRTPSRIATGTFSVRWTSNSWREGRTVGSSGFMSTNGSCVRGAARAATWTPLVRSPLRSQFRSLVTQAVAEEIAPPGDATSVVAVRAHPAHPHARRVAGAALQRLQNLRRPAPRVHLLVPLHDLAVLAYHHSDPLSTLARVRIGAIGRADLPVRVAEQREVEA